MEYISPWWWGYSDLIDALTLSIDILLMLACILWVDKYKRKCHLKAEEEEFKNSIHEVSYDRFKSAVMYCKFIAEKECSDDYYFHPFSFYAKR